MEHRNYDYKCECGNEIVIQCSFVMGFKDIQDYSFSCDKCKKVKLMTVVDDPYCKGCTAKYIKGYELGAMVQMTHP